MKLYCQIVNKNEIRMSWDNIKDRFDQDGNKIDYQSPSHPKDDGWYEISRELNFNAGEYLEYNAETDTIEIKQREKTAEQIALEEFKVQYSLSKIVELQNKAIQALARGEELPQEYQDYTAFREGINAKKQR